MFHVYSGLWGNPFLLQDTPSLLHFITPASTLVHLAHSYPLFTSQFRHLLLLQEASSEPHHLLNSCNACKSLLRDSELQEIKLYFSINQLTLHYASLLLCAGNLALINLELSVFTQLFLQVLEEIEC